MTSTEENRSSKPLATNRRRPRGLRFSLRTFLITVAIFAVTIGWYVDRAERQRRAVQRIEQHGGKVFFDSQGTEDGFQSGAFAGKECVT
jgi:hypothetical protein